MNANELTPEQIMDGLEIEVGKRYGKDRSCQERNFIWEAIRLIDENQKALSRARIRETATEPPTREFDRLILCALDCAREWHFKMWYEIADSPSTYIQWFVIPTPRLPEVTP